MRKFKFRLQTPYDVILWKEKLVKQEVKERQTVYDQEEQDLNQRLEELTGLNNQERGLQGQSVSIERVIVLKELQEMQKFGIKLQQGIVEKAWSRLEDSRQALNEAVTEKKSMDRLRARRYRQFLDDCLRQEQIVIDEVAVTSFWRTKGSYESNQPIRQRLTRSKRF
jgi:flagellar FliJ protein